MSERINTPFTNEHFVAFVKKMVGHPYWYGTCLYSCTESTLKSKSKQYPEHYGSSRMAQYRRDIANKDVASDCVGGCKGYAWTNGGIGVLEAIGTGKSYSRKNGSNGCPDKSANGMFEYAKKKGMDWGVMKLQLLIPQFNETDEVMRPMLDSIRTQQGVNLKNDIEVLIGNDGSDTKLSEELLGSFPFPTRYEQFEHVGLPGTRGRLFDLATADYVMFCDADDMFLTNLALYTILAYIEKGFDALVVDFMEEVIDRKTGRSMFFPHKKDSTFVHGKVYRRQFLLDNNIIWHPDVKCHEDSGYNSLALKVAKDVKHCQIPLYLWKWREGSICRKDPLYVPKTYTRMIYSNGWLVKDFMDRGMVEEAKYYVAVLVYGTYYMLNKRIWLDPMNAKYRYETEKCFQEYFRKHKNLFLLVDPKVRDRIIAGTKRRVLGEGVLLEQFTFNDWIRHIEGLE